VKRGCLEALASGTDIAKRGRELMNLDGGAEEVFEEARTGNNVAKMIIDNAACYLGLAIANLTELLHPEDVVLGGGVTSSWALLEERVRSALDTHRRVEVNLTLTSLGPHNGLLGAGMLPFHHRSQ
ncbi:MAG: ROK family protein, partial [Candidatus Bipolaricaulota bacterium]